MKREILAKIIFALALLCSNAFAYTLTITVSSPGGGTVSPTSKTVSAKTTVSIKATPAAGRAFSSWTYDSESIDHCLVADTYAEATTVYVNDGDCSLRATFITVRNVEVVAGPGGMVAVKEGEWTTSTETPVQNGFSWTIRAMAGAGYMFDKWTSDVETCTFDDAENATTSVHPTTDCKVTASFAVAAELTVSATTGGSVTPSYSEELVKKGSSVNIEATPSADYQFYQWVKKSGDCTISSTFSASTKVTVNGTCSIEADFRKERKLTMVLGTNGSSVSPSGTTTVRDNVATSISAYAKSGYAFGSWSVSGTNCKVSTSTSSSTSAYLQSDCTITANFIPAHTVTIKHVNWDGSGSTYTETRSVGEGKTLSLSPRTGNPYKPNGWKVTSGTCTLSSSTVSPTLTMKTGDCTVETQYVHSVAKKVIVGKTNVVYDDYYQLSPNLMAFVLETEDGVWYRAEFPYSSYLKSYYGSDETLSHEVFNSSVYNTLYIYFKGDGQKHYFTYAYVPSSSSWYSVNITKVTSTVPLEIEATKGGSVNYQGETQAPSNGFLYISAVADPYYKFVKWNVLGGTCSVYNTTNANTYLRNLTGSCHVRAEFEVDSTLIPEVELVQVDQSEYPEKLCFEYKTKKYYQNDFTLYVNGRGYPYEKDSLRKESSNVSIALVIDASGSLGTNGGKNSVKPFVQEYINDLPSGYQLALIAYGTQSSSANILQDLTSDKSALLAGLEKFTSKGPNDIETGVKTALDVLSSAKGEKHILLFTDDPTDYTYPGYTYQSMASRAKSMGVDINAYCWNVNNKCSAEIADAKYMADTTGGQYGKITNLSELHSISSELFGYSLVRRICYVPEDSIPDGDVHEFDLKINGIPVDIYGSITWTEPKCVEKDVEDALFMFNADVPEDDPAYELVDRSSTRLAFRVSTQDFTGDCSPRNSVQVQVSCKNSGDLETVDLDHVLGGTYELKNTLPKQEGSVENGNGILECDIEDEINAKYVDPVYKTVVTRSVMFSDSVKTMGEFSTVGNSATLKYSETYRGFAFDFKVFALSPTTYKADSLDVLLYTSQGDSLWSKVVETGKYTSNFLLRDSVTVVFDDGDMKKDRLEILMSGDKLLNKSLVYARVVEKGKVSDVLDSILVFYDFPEFDIAVYDGEDKDAEIDRATESLRVYVNALDATNGVDTIEARLYCRNSGDSESLKLVQVGDTTDNRKVFGMLSSIPKNELKTVKNDGNLSCAAVDTIVAEYYSPYYKNPVSAEYAFVDSAAIVPVDSAEIYDRDRDGRADFVRIHFTENVDLELLRIDTVFWNANGSKGRGIWDNRIKTSNGEGWFEAELDEAFDYGVSSSLFAEKDYLSVSKKTFNYSQNVKLADKIGAVPVFAKKNPGRMSSDGYLSGEVDLPLDTLVVTLSEPLNAIRGVSDNGHETWQKLFLFAEKCGGKMRPIALKTAPKVDKSGLVWTLVLPREIDVRVGNCLVTNPAASYQDAAGNVPAIGGVTVEGDDGDTHMYAIYPYPAIARDSVSGVRTETKMGYRASVSIFDNLGHVVAQQKYSFGRDGELNDPDLENSENATHFGTITWNQRTEDGRQASSGVYIWKILFVFDDGHREWRYVKSGVKR